MMRRSAFRRPCLAALLLLHAMVGACQRPGGGEGAGFNYDQGPDLAQSGQISPLVGTLGGAGAGALLGRAIAGNHDNTAAILGGALLGGLVGNLGTNAYNTRKEEQATAQYEEQQRFAFAQSQLSQEEALNQQLESRSLYDQWGRQQGWTPSAGAGDVTTAQRMLIVLGYYSGPVDGVNGPATSTAIAEFQKAQGLPITGNVTPALLQQLRVAI
jgi:hypothetical protein